MSQNAERGGAGGRISRLHTAELHPTAGYSHVTMVEAGRLAFLAGQMPVDDTGRQVVGPGDLDRQVDRTVQNSLRALRCAGARPCDVIRSVVYVVGAGTELGRAWHRIAGSALGPALTSASTLLGVTVLGLPGQLVELELTAAVGDPGRPDAT